MSDIPPPPPPGGTPPPPPPAGGGSPLGPLASWGERAGAALINFAMIFVVLIGVAIVGAIFGAVSDVLGGLVTLVGYLAAIGIGFYLYWLDGETGASPGKRVLGLRTLKEDTGQVLGGGQGMVRYLAHIVDSIPCYIGYLFPLWDAKRQTFADKIMGTVVISGQPKQAFGPELLKK